MNDHLFVIAKITPKSEYYPAAREAILGIVSQTRSEAGCKTFNLHEDSDGGALFLYEEWSDEAALEEHYRQSYTRAVFEQYKEWLATPVEVTKIRRLA